MSSNSTRWSIWAAAFFFFATTVWAQGNSQQARVSADVHHDVSPRLKNIPPVPEQAHSPHERENDSIQRGHRKALATDTVVQRAPAAPVNTTPGLSFDGIGSGVYGYTVNVAPPDPNGAAGLTQFVQWVNTSFAVFDKTSGALLYGPAAGNTLWSGFGGPCETKNDGDPVVEYDKIAHRWVLSQFANITSTTGPYYQCVAVSQTEDATGSWYRYAFSYDGSNGSIDYSKMGVWPDAYYVSYNMFNTSGSFLGAQVCAFDRKPMLNGAAATQQCFMLNSSYGGVLPSDMDGNTPPPSGSPNYLVGYQTDGVTSSLDLFKFHVDFTTPANSTLTGPTALSVAVFNEACTGSPCGTEIVPQPGTTNTLDSLGDRPMYRLAYRNFGDHEALVVNHSVLTSGIVGVRWYELRDPNGTPTVYQQSTFSPDTNYRWMGSMAMDNTGDIALGYSVSSSTVYPSIRYTGRLASDTLNQLADENTILSGTASQTQSSGSGGPLHRWGDYTSMAVDPNDDCTFWYTNQYEPSTGAFNWRTKIASFKFPGCTSAAAMVSPQPTTKLSGTSANFTWTTGTGSSVYWIWIGTSVGTSNLYDASQSSNTSATINNLPSDASTIYLRLFSWINNAWQYRDYQYTASGTPPPSPATMTSPVAGSVLPGSSATFQWTTGTGVTSYWIWIGTSAGASDVYDASQGANTSATISGLPTNGLTLYVRLFSNINNAWQFHDYTYTEAGTAVAVPAAMTSPSSGTTLPGASATFNWTTGTAVSSYWIWIGTTLGGSNIYDASQGKATSATITGLPTNGAKLYLRLLSWINGAWQYNDYTYFAAGTPVPATMISPTAGTPLAGPSVTFNWTTGTGVVSYWLWIGTSPGSSNLYDASQGTNTSVTVNPLSTNSGAVYVRLYSWINGGWQYKDYTYGTMTPATMTSPASGSTLSGSSVQFNWSTGVGVSSYWLWVGTSPGAENLYDAGQGTNTSVIVPGLPTNGSTIYVRLYSWINGAWQFNDYSYITGP